VSLNCINFLLFHFNIVSAVLAQFLYCRSLRGSSTIKKVSTFQPEHAQFLTISKRIYWNPLITWPCLVTLLCSVFEDTAHDHARSVTYSWLITCFGHNYWNSKICSSLFKRCPGSVHFYNLYHGLAPWIFQMLNKSTHQYGWNLSIPLVQQGHKMNINKNAGKSSIKTPFHVYNYPRVCCGIHMQGRWLTMWSYDVKVWCYVLIMKNIPTDPLS